MRRQESDRASTAKKRALETADEALHRQESDRASTAKRRATEKHYEALHRQKGDRVRTETPDEALHRRECDRARAARKRALESSEDYSQRKQINRTVMTNKRSKSVSVECAISSFHAEVKFGSDFVCTCCHRIMYRKSVILCNRAS